MNKLAVLQAMGLALVLSYSASSSALTDNHQHTAEDAPARARSFLDVGNLTNKTVYIWDIKYKVDDDWIEFSNTIGNGFELAPGEWSYDCDPLLNGCYFKGASFTNVGWGLREMVSNTNPRTAHYWSVKYACKGEWKGRTLTMDTSSTHYWHEALIVDCGEDPTEFSHIAKGSGSANHSTVLKEFIAGSSYLSFTDQQIESKFYNQDDPSDGIDSEPVPAMINMLQGLAPTTFECRAVNGKTAAQNGQVMSKNSWDQGCECRDEDQTDGRSCLDYGVSYIWDTPSKFLNNIDPIDSGIDLPWLYTNNIADMNTYHLTNGGTEQKEGTLIRTNVNQGSNGSGTINHVVEAGRHNRWQIATDMGSVINGQDKFKLFAGEKQSNGEIQLLGSQHRNKIWSPYSDDTISYELIAPVNMTKIQGETLTAGRWVELILKPNFPGQDMYRFEYRIETDDDGRGWVWTKALADKINNEAILNNYPVRAGEHQSDLSVKTIGSWHRNRIWLATDRPNDWTIELRIH